MSALRDILSYNPKTGELRWKIPSSPQARVRSGSIAGCFTSNGYRQIHFNKKFYLAHRVAWFLYYGKWPARQIDHINEDKADNRIVNLRLATNSQNACNRGKQKNNKSGFLGVSRYKHRDKCWGAEICCEGRKIRLGYFDTPEEAHAVYCAAAAKYHGEFANTGTIP